MSYLLYLHGVNWETFERAFHAKRPDVGGVLVNLGLDHLRQFVFPKLTEAKATAMVTKALTTGIDYHALSSADAKLLDVIVDCAFRTRKLGIKTTPLSPMGIGASWLDELRESFDSYGAAETWRALRNGKRFGAKPARTTSEGAQVLLSPAEVRAASEVLESMVDEQEEDFASEIAEPFSKAAKRKLGLRGTWG